MTPGTAWLLGFVAVLAVSAVTIAVRREPTLVRGSLVFRFTILYVAAAWGVFAWRTGGVPPRMLIAGIIALVITLAMAPWWFVVGGPRTAVVTLIEVCFGRVCAQFRRTESGFAMTVPGGDLHVGVHAPLGKLTLLSFRQKPPHRKGQLFRQLLRKQYRGALPTVRIRMG